VSDAGSGSSGRGIPEILAGRDRLRCRRRAGVEESSESDRERAVGSHGPAHRVSGSRVVALRHGALTLLHGAPTQRYGGCRAATQVVTHRDTVCTTGGRGVPHWGTVGAPRHVAFRRFAIRTRQ